MNTLRPPAWWRTMTDQMGRPQSQTERKRADDQSESEKEYPRRVEAFWRKRDVSPGRRSDDASRFKLTLRDALLLFVGGLGMFSAQLGAQWGLRSDIRDLKTSFDAYQQRQDNTNSVLQRQIDDWSKETNLNRVRIEDLRQEIAGLRGILVGAGVKGAQR